jgi:histidyl-tRNA synthetase
MADKPDKTNKLKARLPRGFADRGGTEIAATRRMLDKIRAVYERYGFEPLETPAIEYTDALGKFLPDQDRPNEGVFSFQDDDEQWLSLRYDLTAPLARYVAENFESLPKPYRSYREGWVFRNEKPGPGRFRQFMQFDADTVGFASMAADAEMCMMAADTMEALGIPRGSYVVKVSNRKVLDGLLESIGLGGEALVDKRLTVLRAIDKLDRLGSGGVRSLLGSGRLDESGDFTRGAGLSDEQVQTLLGFAAPLDQIVDYASDRGVDLKKVVVTPPQPIDEGGAIADDATIPINFTDDDAVEQRPTFIDNYEVLERWRSLIASSAAGRDGIEELARINALVRACGYGSRRFQISSSVVRGLEYYTGPVYEVELTFPMETEGGKSVSFGSVGGGGRYDGLIARFRGEPVPATGFSIGVSRLTAALQHLGKIESRPEPGPVVVTVFDKERIADYQKMVASLRNVGIRAELYLGGGKFAAQMKYADKRGSPCVVIQGGDEKARGEIQVKDLILGAEIAGASKERDDYLKKQAQAQFAVAEEKLVDAVREVLARHNVKWS